MYYLLGLGQLLQERHELWIAVDRVVLGVLSRLLARDFLVRRKLHLERQLRLYSTRVT